MENEQSQNLDQNKKDEKYNQSKSLLNELGKVNIDKYYTGEIIERDGVEYKMLDNIAIKELFDDEKNYKRGRKTTPTKIRKGMPGEVIPTYVKNANGEYVKEGEVIAKEGDYIFQNINDEKDTYIPQNFDINEYSPKTEGDNISEEFKLFIRKSKPDKIIPGIIKEPTIIVVKKWNNYEQTLDVGSTLKLDGDEVTGINKGGFEAWSITDKEGNIISK